MTKRVSMITEKRDGDESNGKSLFSNSNYGNEKLITFIFVKFLIKKKYALILFEKKRLPI